MSYLSLESINITTTYTTLTPLFIIILGNFGSPDSDIYCCRKPTQYSAVLL